MMYHVEANITSIQQCEHGPRAAMGSDQMTLVEELDHWYGFPNPELFRAIKSKGLDKTFSDIERCKLTLLAAMESPESDIYEQAEKMLAALRRTHERTAPCRLLQWIIQIQKGKDLENLGGQIADWAKVHPDDLVYSRATLWIAQRTCDPIELIAKYVMHVEIFWDDDLAWYHLGKLYVKQEKYPLAIFAFEEAIGLAPKWSYYYREAAEARLQFGARDAVEANIARQQLCKAVTLNDADLRAWELLIENTTDRDTLRKFKDYRDKVAKRTKTD